MTTQTPPSDPQIEAWSNDLEADLVEAGMEQPQARVYRRSFELGLTRLVSQTVTRQEHQDGLVQGRQELRQAIDDLRREMDARFDDLRREMDARFDDLRREVDALRREMDIRFAALQREMNIRFGVLVGMFAGVFTLLGVILSRI